MQEYVKKDVSLVRRVVALSAFSVTQKMKDDALKLDVINEETVRAVVKEGRKEARQVIDALLSDGDIKTKEVRYAELYPPEEEIV